MRTKYKRECEEQLLRRLQPTTSDYGGCSLARGRHNHGLRIRQNGSLTPDFTYAVCAPSSTAYLYTVWSPLRC